MLKLNPIIKLSFIFIQSSRKNGRLFVSPFVSSDNSQNIELLKILNSSFENNFDDLSYIGNLIKEVEEVMGGKREKTGWWYGDGDGTVDVYKEKTLLVDAFSPHEGELPTTEIYELLKDWLEFLKEYYKRSFVPLEWIKEEYLEEARKLQKPING
jgi:hypothetical protein